MPGLKGLEFNVVVDERGALSSTGDLAGNEAMEQLGG